MLNNKYNPKLDKTKVAKHDKIRAFRKYAEVAQASYCLKLKTNLGSIENDEDFINALSDKGYSQHFSKEQAKSFAQEYQVMAHYEMPKNNSGFKEIASNIANFINDDGFSATLFLDKNTKDYILAFRGTEGSFDGIDKINNAIRDFYTDFLLATNEIPNQYFTLIGFFENTIKNIIGDNKIVVTGHSLGGFLAQSFALTYPDRIKEVYTYNSPGLLPDDRKYIAEATKIAIGVTNKLYKAVKDIKNGNLKSAITSSSEAVDKILSYSLFSDRYDYRAFIVTNELKSLKFIDGLFDKNQNTLPYHVTNAILESYNFGSSCLFFGYGVYVCLHFFRHIIVQDMIFII